jgi:hypothetical protein
VKTTTLIAVFLFAIFFTTNAQNAWRADPFMGAPSFVFWGDSITHIRPQIKPVKERRYQNLTEIGILTGVSSYQGDLIKNRFDASMVSPTFSAMMRYHATRKMAITFGFTGGTVIGGIGINAAIAKGFTMKANYTEIQGRAEWYPLGKAVKKEEKSGISFPMPYVFAGASYGVSNPEVFLNRELQKPEGGATNGFLAIPLGIGFRLKMPDEFCIGSEIGLRMTNTDYLDGVSKRGNPNNRDTYVVAGVYVMYIFD